MMRPPMSRQGPPIPPPEEPPASRAGKGTAKRLHCPRMNLKNATSLETIASRRCSSSTWTGGRTGPGRADLLLALAAVLRPLRLPPQADPREHRPGRVLPYDLATRLAAPARTPATGGRRSIAFASPTRTSSRCSSSSTSCTTGWSSRPDRTPAARSRCATGSPPACW